MATPISNSHRWFVIAASIILVGMIYFLAKGLQKSGTQIPSALIGKAAPAFNVAELQGSQFLDGQQQSSRFTMADFEGRPVIVNFWASWCYSCRQEAKDLEKVWLELKERGVMVVGIAIQDTQEAAMGFAKQYGKTYLLGLDEDGKASIDYGITGVPESFFINSQGTVVHKEAAPLTLASLREHSQKILP